MSWDQPYRSELKVTGVSINQAGSTDVAVVAAPGAKKQIWVYHFHVSMDTDGTYQFKSATTALTGTNYLLAYIPDGHPMGTSPIFKCGTNEALNLIHTQAIGGNLSYQVVEVTA